MEKTPDPFFAPAPVLDGPAAQAIIPSFRFMPCFMTPRCDATRRVVWF